MSRTAVVLLNLGGPDRPEAVEPFLFNLFFDPAIIRLPTPLRWLLARLISRRRAPVAREIYHQMGGGSPIVANTEAQAAALADALQARPGIGEVRVFIAMRYWPPRAEAAARAVAAFAPDQVVLLPLYPQYSTTTTASSLREWEREARAAGLAAPTRAICCYPEEEGFIEAVAEGVRAALRDLDGPLPPRVLFSAHGLPKKIVEQGDPYQWQVEQSVAAAVRRLGAMNPDWINLDWRICYQSRVGPLEWIGPATDHEIEKAAREGRPTVVVPIAFVSEHSETLVELDIEYRRLAARHGAPAYVRVATVGTAAPFVAGLAGLVVRALETGEAVASQAGGRLCPGAWRGCAQAAE